MRQTTRATVHPLLDGAGLFFQPRTEAFPAATAEQWRWADTFDPDVAAPDDGWLLPFRCYAIRLDGRLVLVDAGIGPADSPAAGWAPVPGRLPAALAEAGIEPGEVDVVVLTHLHTDHVGWAVTGARPYFANARYVLQAAEVAAVGSVNPGLASSLLAPLRDTGQLSIVEGEHRLAAGLRVLATPGHTPGHQIVLLDDGDETIAFLGDLLLHAVHLLDPTIEYGLDHDPARAVATRQAMLRSLAGRPRATLAASHLGQPFVALPVT